MTEECVALVVGEWQRNVEHWWIEIWFYFYGSAALYGPGPPRFVEVSWSHTFETHHSR
jgi:hypothetical protein